MENKTISALEVLAESMGYKLVSTAIIEAEKVTDTKPFVLTSQDGVNLYEGDECWCLYVNLKNDTDIFKWKIELRDKENNENNEYLFFSTEEAAQQYLDENLPKYSIKDIYTVLTNFILNADMFDDRDVTEFLELLKSTKE